MDINSLLASKETKEMKERNRSHLIGTELLNILANTQTTVQSKKH